MKFLNQALAQFSSVGLGITRVVLGALFILHGLDKFDAGLGNVGDQFEIWGVPAAGNAAAVVAVLEVLLGFALVIGIGARVSALVLALILVGAIFYAKADGGILGSAELDMAYLAGLTSLILVGPGKYSLDYAVNLESGDA